ncbi:part of a binding-protein-dependent transport system [Arthrobacter sp. Hiyo4]|nr:part of a binding-protein-dependent transport system [Arthrobacter sp. Hiyo4]
MSIAKSDLKPTALVVNPKTAAVRQKPLRKVSFRWVMLTVVVAFVGLYLILPTLFIIPMSFSGASSLGRFNGEWTFKWYEELFAAQNWARAAGVSFQVGLLSTAVATTLGTAATFGLFKLSPGSDR